jgi:hypothetical protein
LIGIQEIVLSLENGSIPVARWESCKSRRKEKPLGSRSQGGERTIERLLSVDQTCRLQRRSLYAYLADALTAKARGDPVPSLMGA